MSYSTMCKTELKTKGEIHNAKCNDCNAAYMREWRSRQFVLELSDYDLTLIE